MRLPRLGLLAGALLAPAAANAQTTVFYSNNFESGVGSGWGTAAHTVNAPTFGTFLGRYASNEGILLTIPTPSTPSLQTGQSIQWHATFDFYAIDSWDGNDTANGPDYFCMNANGSCYFAETFANQHNWQSFRLPDVGPDFLGFRTDTKDSIYYNIDVPFNTGGSGQIQLSWYALGLSGATDESWGIDNLRVSYSVVPTPASASLLGLSGLVALRRRRR